MTSRFRTYTGRHHREGTLGWKWLREHAFAAELGCHVTLIKDATAAISKDRMHAAHDRGRSVRLSCRKALEPN